MATKTEKLTLGEFIKKSRLEQNLSLDDVVRRARREVSKAYLSRIENGYQDNPTPKILKALARGLGVAESIVFEIAKGAAPEETDEFQKSGFARIWEKYERLSFRDKQETDILLRSLEGWIDSHSENAEESTNIPAIKGGR